MQRYFSKKIDNKFILSSDDSYHITKVMRMALKDKIEVIDEGKCYIAEITNLIGNVECEIVDVIEEDKELDYLVTLAQSLVKEQKMDFVLQKATELGVSEIIPLEVTRSVIKVNDKKDKKVDRWNKIVKEASEQSKRISIPIVRDILDVKKLCNLDEYDIKILCTVRENSKNIKNVLSNLKQNAKILVVVGPEGGFTIEEENQMIDSGFISVSLGKTVLRSETVALFIMSVINYHSMR